HLVSITHTGRVPYVRELELRYGKTSTIDAELRTTTQRKASRVVLMGGGVLAIATGLEGLAAYSADSDASKLQKQLASGGQMPATLAQYDLLKARRDDRVRTTEILGGVGAVVLVTGALMYAFDDPSPEGMAPLRDDDAAAAKSKKKIDIE